MVRSCDRPDTVRPPPSSNPTAPHIPGQATLPAHRPPFIFITPHISPVLQQQETPQSGARTCHNTQDTRQSPEILVKMVWRS